MLFAINALDKDDHLAVRQATREAHLAYLDTVRDKILLAGPVLSDDGASSIGSLIIIDLADRAAVDAFVAADPYTKAALFRRVDIAPFRQVIPTP